MIRLLEDLQIARIVRGQRNVYIFHTPDANGRPSVMIRFDAVPIGFYPVAKATEHVIVRLGMVPGESIATVDR